MKTTLSIIIVLVLASCQGTTKINACKRIDNIYNYLIHRELYNPNGINYTKIDSLVKERERKIKMYSKF